VDDVEPGAVGARRHVADAVVRQGEAAGGRVVVGVHDDVEAGLGGDLGLAFGGAVGGGEPGGAVPLAGVGWFDDLTAVVAVVLRRRGIVGLPIAADPGQFQRGYAMHAGAQVAVVGVGGKGLELRQGRGGLGGGLEHVIPPFVVLLERGLGGAVGMSEDDIAGGFDGQGFGAGARPRRR